MAGEPSEGLAAWISKALDRLVVVTTDALDFKRNGRPAYEEYSLLFWQEGAPWPRRLE